MEVRQHVEHTLCVLVYKVATRCLLQRLVPLFMPEDGLYTYIMCVCACVCICVCVCVRTHTHTHNIYIHLYTYKPTSICIHTHTCIHIYILYPTPTPTYHADEFTTEQFGFLNKLLGAILVSIFQLRHHRLGGTHARIGRRLARHLLTFSKVSIMPTSQDKYTRTLTFENFCTVNGYTNAWGCSWPIRMRRLCTDWRMVSSGMLMRAMICGMTLSHVSMDSWLKPSSIAATTSHLFPYLNHRVRSLRISCCTCPLFFFSADKPKSIDRTNPFTAGTR
jgi:hypothetical protein